MISPETIKTEKKKNKLFLLASVIVLFLGVFIFSFYRSDIIDDLLKALNRDHHIFYWMLLVGFCAEVVAGSMGMGYGVLCTTILLSMNIAPPIVSASIHSAESFTTMAGGISHYKLKNVNKKLVWRLAPFAVIGAIIGALSLAYFGERYVKIVKPLLSAYTLYLGFKILMNARNKVREKSKTKKKLNLTILGITGGFIDSFAGGGWGPLVTGALIENGRTPRYVVGSSTVAKLILTLTSAITFIFTIGIGYWNIILGLILGGVITAPFSAMLTAKLPAKKMFSIMGILVILMSFVSLYKGIKTF